MKNVDHIITARHYSKSEGADGTVVGRLKKMQEAYRRKSKFIVINGVDEPRGGVVRAQINQGAWIGTCECGGAEFVDPTEPIFFCWNCVNRANGGYVRPVEFPENREEIERAVLKRRVDDVRGITDEDRAFLARPLITFTGDGRFYPATRSWIPGESVETIREQNEFIENALKKQENE